MICVVKDWYKITMLMVSQSPRSISIPKITSWSPLLSIPKSKFGKSIKVSLSIPSMVTMAAPIHVLSPNMETTLLLEVVTLWLWSGRPISKANKPNSYRSLMALRLSLFLRSKVPTSSRMPPAGWSKIRTRREKAQEMCWKNKKKDNHMKMRSKFPLR